MGVSKSSGAMRIALGVSLVLFALATGLLQRSPWILPFLGTGFTAAYLFGQLRTWRHARNTGKLRHYWLQLPADFGVQLLLVSMLYLIGFGLSALVSGGVTIAPFAPGDAIWPVAIGAVGAILGVYIDRIEGKPSTYFPAWMTGKDGADETPREALRLLPEPVTLQSFFTAPADTVSASEHEAAAWADAYSTLTEGLSEDDITRAEARLGRALPDLLIALYRQQNGGTVAPVCIPLEGHPEPTQYAHVILPFGGSDDLVPAESLRSVWDTMADYADPDSPEGALQPPDGAKAMIVLAQWYRETLFLDYNQPGAPRVGYTDFDRIDLHGNRDTVTWWKDFETFFAALRHYEPA